MLKLTYLACRSEDKLSALLHLIKNLIDERGQTIVFAATKHHVEFIHQVCNIKYYVYLNDFISV
jgi:ATP-dependent RNA helicase DDX54/DBP10